jgi:Flp pilus assembly protein TadD
LSAHRDCGYRERSFTEDAQVPDGASPPFTIFLIGHGAAGARCIDAADAATDEAPDVQAALQVFARAVHVDSDDPDYHFILGRALIEAGRLVEALAALRTAVRLHPEVAEYRLGLGHALWHAGRFAQAANAFSEATRLQPTDAAAWSGLGAARLAADAVADALPAIDEALRLDEHQADAASNRGVALWQRGDVPAAMAAFEAAARLATESAFAQRNLGLALLALDRPEDALAALLAAWQLRQEDTAIRVDMAETLVQLGRDEEAHADFCAALEISPTCLDGRPQAREAFLALEAAALREELQPQRSLLAAAIAPVVLAQSFLTAVLRRLLTIRRRAAAMFGFALLAGSTYPLWHLTPVYVRHYLFVDDLGVVASTPLGNDREVSERLMHIAQRRGLANVIDATSCQIASAFRWRTITCRYQVTVSLLPGVRRTLTFETCVERFYVARDEAPGGLGEQPGPGSAGAGG